MTNFDITDMTFTIPVRIDNEERLRHLMTTVTKIKERFDTNILIGELSKHGTVELKRFCRLSGCGYVYFKTNEPYFHRTKLLNDLARIATTRFIANLDSDVAMETNAILEGVNCLRDTNFDIVIPYNGTVVNIINKTTSNITSKNACGGAVFWDRERFFRFGMENEYFIDWGFEDNERLSRAKTLGLTVRKLSMYKLYHLNHAKSKNHETPMMLEYQRLNKIELNKIVKMKRKELVEYIKTWDWL